MAGALDGIKVLDLSRVFAGPAATQILGDLGADVVKVEDPAGGDDARYYGVDSAQVEAFGASPPFLALNRNKRSVAIDLRCEAGQELAVRLAESSDVLLHNFRPGVMERWRLGYERLAARSPRLVYCDFSAYGRTGPLSHVGANDLALQAHSGLMSMTGEEGGGPVRCGSSVVDLHGAVAMVAAVLAALFHRERTGQGQRVESSLLLSSAHLLNYFYTEYWLDGTIRGPMGTANHLTVPNQAFPTTDGHAIIIAASDEMWRRCARALDPERLDVPEFRTADGRRQHRRRLVELLGGITSRLSTRELMERLASTRVVVSKVNSVGEAADHEQLAAVGGVVELDHDGGRLKAVASPFQMSATPVAVSLPPPTLGAHTEEVLRERGLSRQEIDELGSRGAFGAGFTASR